MIFLLTTALILWLLSAWIIFSFNRQIDKSKSPGGKPLKNPSQGCAWGFVFLMALSFTISYMDAAKLVSDSITYLIIFIILYGILGLVINSKVKV